MHKYLNIYNNAVIWSIDYYPQGLQFYYNIYVYCINNVCSIKEIFYLYAAVYYFYSIMINVCIINCVPFETVFIDYSFVHVLSFLSYAVLIYPANP